MTRRIAPFLSLSIVALLAAPAAAQIGSGVLVRDAVLRAGPGDGMGAVTTLPAGTRVTVTARAGEAARLDLRPTVARLLVRADGDGVRRAASRLRVRAGGETLGWLDKGARMQRVAGAGWWSIEVGAYVPAAAIRFDASEASAFAGTWQVRGAHSRRGAYEGEVVVHPSDGGFGLQGSGRFGDGSVFAWSGQGRLDGGALRVEVTYDRTGLVGALDPAGAAGRGSGAYRLSGGQADEAQATGGWRGDAGVGVEETWTRGRPGDASGPDDLAGDPADDPADGPSAAPTRHVIDLPPRLLAVPGTPAAGHQPVRVLLEGAGATLRLAGPGRLLTASGAVALEPGRTLALEAGEHRFQAEGSGDGALVLTLEAAGAELASARSEVAVERLYLLLFGYQGTETDYLVGDIRKTVDNILPHLGGAYVRVEDGPSYDQGRIDAAIDDPARPRKLLVDWCTTRADMVRYFARGTLRGVVWGSHGFMEPYPGCPDDELDMFESRVWTAGVGRPEDTEHKTFVRLWREGLAASVRTHGKLDFALMHSCCTGTIGSYRDEVWDYTAPETKARARRVLGEPLPVWTALRYTSFDVLAPQVNFLQTYEGPSYYGFFDVSWTRIRRSLEPAR